MAPTDTPQFVIITHDDAIDATANRAVRSLTDGYKNSNGCNVAATWFVTQAGTDCNLAKKLWQENHEIALHTVNHAQLVTTLKNMKEEILGVRTFLNQTCGIPLTDMLGFRSPYLVNNPKVRTVLTEGKLLYDSSITESIGGDSITSSSFGQRIFPYTMDNGIVQNCNWTYPDGQCTATERYPGFWEIPMWNLPFADEKTQVNAYSMDPDVGFGGDLFTTLTTNFDRAYTGNRAPFPIYVHAPWFTPSHVAAAKKFVEYALAKPNVYFVTIQQLLKWMQNPVPASQMGSFLQCNSVTVKAPAPPPPCQVYTIETGDFIDLIAGKFGVEPKDLLALNPTVTPMSIQPGLTLKIPPWTANCEAGGVPAQTPGAAAAAPTAAANTTATTPQAASPNADPESAFNPSSAPDRLEMDFVLLGLSKNAFDVSGHNQIINSLAQMLEVFPDRIFVSATLASRRRRALLQDPAATATPALNVHAVVAAEDPAALYFKAISEIDQGEFEGFLTALGFSARAPPTLKAFLGNVEMQPMTASSPPVAAQTPAQPQAQAAEEKSALPMAAIIGIAVGGGVALIAVIVGTVLLVRRSRAKARDGDGAYDKHHDEEEEEAGSNGFAGVMATLKVRTAWKGSDSSFVLKGETPTSATFRNNASANNAFRV